MLLLIQAALWLYADQPLVLHGLDLAFPEDGVGPVHLVIAAIGAAALRILVAAHGWTTRVVSGATLLAILVGSALAAVRVLPPFVHREPVEAAIDAAKFALL